MAINSEFVMSNKLAFISSISFITSRFQCCKQYRQKPHGIIPSMWSIVSIWVYDDAWPMKDNRHVVSLVQI